MSDFELRELQRQVLTGDEDAFTKFLALYDRTRDRRNPLPGYEAPQSQTIELGVGEIRHLNFHLPVMENFRGVGWWRGLSIIIPTTTPEGHFSDWLHHANLRSHLTWIDKVFEYPMQVVSRRYSEGEGDPVFWFEKAIQVPTASTIRLEIHNRANAKIKATIILHATFDPEGRYSILPTP